MAKRDVTETLASGTRIKVAAAISSRPRTLAELADLTGITVQGALKHVKALEAIGFADEKKVSGSLMRPRKVYEGRGERVADFSGGGTLAVRISRPVKASGPHLAASDLERVAVEGMLLRRRVKEQVRRLSHLIDDLMEDEERIKRSLDSSGFDEDEKLMLKVLYSEESLAEGAEVLLRYYAIKGGRRSIDKALAKAKRHVRE